MTCHINCIKCNSDRILEINGKCSDLCFTAHNDKNHTGYVPNNVNIGGGDYIEFDYCLDCGQIQSNDFPIAEEFVEAIFKKD